MSLQTFRVVIWDNEDLHAPPGRAVKRITVSNMLSATLNWNFKPEHESLTTFKNIMFNGSIVSNNRQGSADVTNLLVVNGDNSLTVNYDSFDFWMTRARCDADIVIVGHNTSLQEPDKTYGLSSLPWWVWALVAVLVLAVLVWWLTGTRNGQRAWGMGMQATEKLGKGAGDLALLAAGA